MRFLADMGISPQTAAVLRELGHNAAHLHDQNLDRLPDPDILNKARREGRIVLTHDLDFGDLLAAGKLQLPSVIIFRLHNMRPERVERYLKEIITRHGDELEKGALSASPRGRSESARFPFWKRSV